MNNGKQIKRELYKSYLILVRSLYQQSQPDFQAPKIGEKRKRFLVGSIIFLAFAMESFINDFGERFVDNFEDFEKNEPKNKYLVFPKLARENSAEIIKKSEHSYFALKSLFMYRNFFVHHKPAFRNSDTNEEQLYSELDHELVKILYIQMIKIIKSFNNQFNVFIEADDWITDYSEDINAGV